MPSFIEDKISSSLDWILFSHILKFSCMPHATKFSGSLMSILQMYRIYCETLEISCPNLQVEV